MSKRKIYFDETSKITKEGKKELKRLLKIHLASRHAIDKFLYNPYGQDDWTPGTDSDVRYITDLFGIKI